MNKTLKAAKENIDLLVTIAGAVGFGSPRWPRTCA